MAAHHVLTSHAFTKKETDQLSVPLQMARHATSETSFVTLSQKRMTLRVEAVLYHVHQHELAVRAHILLRAHHLPHFGSVQHHGHFLLHRPTSNQRR